MGPDTKTNWPIDRRSQYNLNLNAREYKWATLFLGGHKYRNMALKVGGLLKIEPIKYARESRGTQTEQRLRWRCAGKTANYRPDFSSERAPHTNKSVTV
jgi:hypothetical protein